MKNILIILIKHGCIILKHNNADTDNEILSYNINISNILNRLRLGRFINMSLPIENRQNDMNDNKQMLLSIIESGSIQGNHNMEDLIKNAYLIRSEYDIQRVANDSHGNDDKQYEFFKPKVEEVKNISDSIVDQHAFYSLNYRQFIHVLRNHEIKDLAGAKLDFEGGHSPKNVFGIGRLIVSLFLDHSKYTDKSEVFENSEVLSFTEIQQKLKEIYKLFEEEGKEDEMSLLKPLIENDIILKSHIERIQNDSLEPLKKVKVDVHTGEPFYALKIQHLVTVLQKR
mmetsp:Transcript_17477/g.15409  ORF Transcript_17477/g.15409 Transcript_17477/m.15409 type:complete len:284 (+) Transcript_17477:141-992(+)